MSSRVAVVQCQRRLLAVWGGIGGIALIMVLIQTSPSGTYHEHASDLWEWFLPTVVPTVSLLLGTLVAQAREPEQDATVDVFYYRLALWSSVLYLAIVVALLMMYAQSRTPVADLKGSSRIVTALYGIVGIALGTFLVSKKSGAVAVAGERVAG